MKIKNLFKIKCKMNHYYIYTCIAYGLLSIHLTMAQDFMIQDNSLPPSPVSTSFLQSTPFPALTTTSSQLDVGKGFDFKLTRGVFFGGNMGVSQHTYTFGTLGGKWSFSGAWQKSFVWPTPSPGLPPFTYSFSPGIDYLVDYHRWGNYAAHFGLRASSYEILAYEEGTSIPADLSRKDAVITWSSEKGVDIPDNRLIFQSIEGVDATSGYSNQVPTEWATILSTGNFGFGTSNPNAQFQIKSYPTILGRPLIPFQLLDDNDNPRFTITKEGKCRLGIATGLGVLPMTEVLEVFGNIKQNGNIGINKTGTPLVPLDVVGNATILGNSVFDGITECNGPLTVQNSSLSVIGVSYFQPSTSSSTVLKVSSSSDADNFKITNDGSLFIKNLKDPSGTNDFALMINNKGQIFSTPLINVSSPLLWKMAGNTSTLSNSIFGTTTATDITLTVGDVSTLSNINFVKINGATAGIEGFTNFTKNVSISGGNTSTGLPTGGLPIIDPEYSLTVKTSFRNRSTYSGALGLGILNCLDGTAPLFKIGNAVIYMFNDNYFFISNYAEFPGNIECPNISLDQNILPKAYYPPGGGPRYYAVCDIGSPSKEFKTIHAEEFYSFGQPHGTSDMKTKENIKPIGSTINLINGLNPVKYNFIKKPGKLQYGFIAQDLELIFPNLVNKPEDSETYFVNYIGLIPILTKGMQEQQLMIDSLKLKVALVEDSNHKPLLLQNSPQIIEGFTLINYYLPDNSNSAFLKVTDNNGKLIKSFSINKTGFGQIELDCRNLSSATYQYSLLVDSEIIANKTLIISPSN